MEEIKQLHQTLELNVERIQQALDDLKKVAVDETLLDTTKTFKIGELSCVIGMNLEDLKLDLDELGRLISKQKAEPVKKDKPVNVSERLDKILKDKLTQVAKEFRSGYSEVNHEVDRVVESTWNDENGINYQVVTKHNEKKGYKTEVYVYIKNRSIRTAEECIDIIKPIIEKIGVFKWLPTIPKRNVVAYVSEDSFKSIHNELIKKFNSHDLDNRPLGCTEITSSYSKKYIILNNQSSEIKIEASYSIS